MKKIMRLLLLIVFLGIPTSNIFSQNEIIFLYSNPTTEFIVFPATENNLSITNTIVEKGEGVCILKRLIPTISGFKEIYIIDLKINNPFWLTNYSGLTGFLGAYKNLSQYLGFDPNLNLMNCDVKNPEEEPFFLSTGY